MRLLEEMRMGEDEWSQENGVKMLEESADAPVKLSLTMCWMAKGCFYRVYPFHRQSTL